MRTRVEIGEEEARLAVDAIVGELKKRGKAAVVAVADAHGELIALWRMDGAPLPSLNIATNKAFTAARNQGPSGDVGRGSRKDGWDIVYMGDPRFTGWDGGLPVLREGKVIGAVAVSGLTGAEDLELATLAVRRLAESTA